MSVWRSIAYLAGITILILSKYLVALSLDVIHRIWNPTDQLATYWYGKGPIILIATILVVFGIDHMLFPNGALMSWGQESNLPFVQAIGVVALGIGIYLLYAALFGRAVAW